MKVKWSLFLAVLMMASLATGSMARAADSALCKYNEWSGELVVNYEAHDAKQSRGWVPLAVALCKDSKGSRYVILTYQAVGLGYLRDLPLRALEPGLKPEAGVKYSALVAAYDETEAYELLKNPNVEQVIFFGDSKTQILAYRKQLGRIVSNTLFLKEK